MILTIRKKQIEPDIVVLEISGQIFLGRECKEIEWQVEDLVRKNQNKVIFDISGVSSVDSTGIGIIVTSFGLLKKSGGELRLAGAQGKVAELLKLTKVDQIIRPYPTAAAAAESFVVAGQAGQSV